MSISRIASGAIAACLAFTPLAALQASSNEENETVTSETPSAPPIAAKRDHSYTHHGITVSDPYHWLKDQSYPTIDDAERLV